MFVSLTSFTPKTVPSGIEDQTVTNQVIQSDSVPDLAMQVKDIVMEILTSFQGTISTAADWVFNKIEASLVRTVVVEAKRVVVDEGIIMKDKFSGKTYCVVVENGEVVAKENGCSVEINNNEGVRSEEQDNEEQIIEQTEQGDDNNNENEGSDVQEFILENEEVIAQKISEVTASSSHNNETDAIQDGDGVESDNATSTEQIKN